MRPRIHHETPRALDVIASHDHFGAGPSVWRGTVSRRAETARGARPPGRSQFIVAPSLTATPSQSQRYSIPVLPGAYTPTEIQPAWQPRPTWSGLPRSVGGPGSSRPLSPAARTSHGGRRGCDCRKITGRRIRRRPRPGWKSWGSARAVNSRLLEAGFLRRNHPPAPAVTARRPGRPRVKRRKQQDRAPRDLPRLPEQMSDSNGFP